MGPTAKGRGRDEEKGTKRNGRKEKDIEKKKRGKRRKGKEENHISSN